MFEIKRNILNKKIIILVAILLILNYTLFLLSCNESKEISLTGENLHNYIDVIYPKFLKNTSEQADMLNLLALSGNEGGFVKNNIEKTKNEYKQLTGIEPEYGENKGVVVFGNFHLTDIIFIGILFIIVFGFNEENKKGLSYLLRSTANGRTRLSVYRIISLFIGAAVACAALYGGNILAAVISYGDMEALRPIQSVPEFILCAWKISISQYMLYSVFIKYITGAALAILLYLLMSIFGTIITAVGVAVITVASFMSYAFILPTSSLNLLKFANLFALLKTDDFFKEYCNLNLFGVPVNMLSVALFMVFVVLIVSIIASVTVNGFMYEKPSGTILSTYKYKVSSFFSKKTLQLPLFLWEGKKILLHQKGIVFMVVCFYLALSAALEYRYFYPINKYELEWHDKFDGIITQELYNEMSSEKDILYEDLVNKKKYQTKLELKGDRTSLEYDQLILETHKLEDQLAALERVFAQMESGLNYNIETGREVWLIKPYSYKLLFIDDVKTTKRNNIYMILGIIGALAGIMSYENQSGMMRTVRTAFLGRGQVLASKIIWVFLISSLLAVSIHMIQFILIKSILGYNDLQAPIASLVFMRDFPLYITIKQYFILLFMARVGISFACGIFVGAVSRLRRDNISVMGICVFCILIPYILLVF